MSVSGLRERIGIDFGPRLRLEDAIAWASGNGVRYMDVRLGDAGNEFETFDAERIQGARALLERHGLHLGGCTRSRPSTWPRPRPISARRSTAT